MANIELKTGKTYTTPHGYTPTAPYGIVEDVLISKDEADVRVRIYKDATAYANGDQYIQTRHIAKGSDFTTYFEQTVTSAGMSGTSKVINVLGKAAYDYILSLPSYADWQFKA